MSEQNPSGDVYSLDDLDQILNKEDPGFSESLESIKKEAIEDASSIESLGVESQVNEDSDEDVEKKSFKKKLLGILLYPWTRCREWFRLHWVAWVNRFHLVKDRTVQFVKFELPERIKYYKSQIKVFFQYLQAQVQRFKALSRMQKIASVLIVGFAVLAFYFLFRSFDRNWLPQWHNPLIGSFAQKAKPIGQVISSEDMIPFFEAFPEVEISFLLSKMVVNLTPSAGIPRPMGAFEFFLGLDAKETAIEVKDREKELLDLVQRTVEQFTYNEVMSPAGQVRMKSRIRDAINERLNQGRVTRVYISTMVTYR